MQCSFIRSGLAPSAPSGRRPSARQIQVNLTDKEILGAMQSVPPDQGTHTATRDALPPSGAASPAPGGLVEQAKADQQCNEQTDYDQGEQRQ